MFCRQVQSLLDDYILNQLDKNLVEQIDNHLMECLDCQKLLESDKQLFSVIKSLATPNPGDYYWKQLEESILAKALGNNKPESDISEPIKISPISLLQRYLIPLAASFILLFGSLLFSDLVNNINSAKPMIVNDTSIFMNKTISNGSDSQIFTTIVAAAPGSLGRHLVFSDITGGAR